VKIKFGRISSSGLYSIGICVKFFLIYNEGKIHWTPFTPQKSTTVFNFTRYVQSVNVALYVSRSETSKKIGVTSDFFKLVGMKLSWEEGILTVTLK